MDSGLRARLTAARKLPGDVRVAALGEALRAVGTVLQSSEVDPVTAHTGHAEATAFATELLELAVPPKFAEADAPSKPASPLSPTWWARFMVRDNRALADLALREVAGSWRAVPEELKPLAAAAGRGRWRPVMEELSRSADPKVRLAMADLVGFVGAESGSGVITRLLADGDPGVAGCLEEALFVLAVGVMKQIDSNRTIDALAPLHEMTNPGAIVEAEEIAQIIGDALDQYNVHRRRGVITAALVLAERAGIRRGLGAPLLERMADPTHPAHEPAKSVLRTTKLPTGGVLALEWLREDRLARAALLRLDAMSSGSGVGSILAWEPLLGACELALHPVRARRLRSLNKNGTRAALPTPAITAALCDEAKIGLTRWARVLKPNAKDIEASLAPLIHDENPIVRATAARVLPLNALSDMVFDPEPAVARIAIERWSIAGDTGVRESLEASAERAAIAANALRSPHAAVRAVAATETRALLVPGAQTVAARLAARRWMLEDPEGFKTFVHGKLFGDDAEERATCLKLVRALHAVKAVEEELVGYLAERAVEKTAVPMVKDLATVVAALAEGVTRPSVRAVASVLAHSDARVRANAVETLAKRERTGVAGLEVLPRDAIVELKGDANHRVRANALMAEVGAGGGAGIRAVDPDGLSAMLMDARPMHRLAGAWATGRVLSAAKSRRADQPIDPAWAELSARVIEIAGFDPNADVRRRAAWAAAFADTLEGDRVGRRASWMDMIRSGIADATDDDAPGSVLAAGGAE